MPTNPEMSEQGDKLKPCPFCGHEVNAVSDNGNGVVFTVICGNGVCRARGPWERCAGDAPSGWNGRVGIEQLQRINAELREGLEQASRALKPIADRVFNDNGDHAISTAPFEDTVFSDCYFAAKRIRTLLSNSEGGHE